MPEGDKKENWKKADKMCLWMTRKFMDGSVHHHIIAEMTTHAARTTLKDIYENPSPISKVLALGRFVYLEYTYGTLMLVHLNKIKVIINPLNYVNRV